MKILLVCSLFVASALAHGNYNYNSGSSSQGGYSSGGLIDVPYEVLYDSRRDGPNVPASIRQAQAGLIDVPYEVLYDSRRDGPQGMNNQRQQPMMRQQQPMMRQQQPMMRQQQQMRQVQQPMRNTYQPSNYGGSSNLIDVPYIVEYDSRRDGPNSPKKDLFRNSNLIDVPYITVYDSRRDGPQRRF